MITSTADWRVVREDATKRVLMRYDAATDEIVFCEEWLEDAVFAQAQMQREVPLFEDPNMRPLAVLPPSIEAQAIKEGWIRDQKKLRQFAADIDHRKVQL